MSTKKKRTTLPEGRMLFQQSDAPTGIPKDSPAHLFFKKTEQEVAAEEETLMPPVMTEEKQAPTPEPEEIPVVEEELETEEEIEEAPVATKTTPRRAPEKQPTTTGPKPRGRKKNPENVRPKAAATGSGKMPWVVEQPEQYERIMSIYTTTQLEQMAQYMKAAGMVNRSEFLRKVWDWFVESMES